MIQPTQSLTPASMEIGAILSTTFKVYRSQFWRFFLISLRAFTWVFAVICVSTIALLAIIAVLVVIFGRQDSISSNLILGLAIFASAIAWLGFYLFSFAKFLANSALISKLTFNILANSTESPRQSTESIKGKTWAFFRIAFYSFMTFLLIYIFSWILGGILVFTVTTILELSNSGEVAVAMGFIGSSVIYFLAVLCFLAWLFSRWFVPEVALAVEDISGAVDSLSRSWDLSKSSVFKLIVVAFIGWLITTPITVAISLLPIIVTGGFDTSTTMYQSIAVLASILNAVVSIAILPFWQTIKGVLYYDLRAQARELPRLSSQ
ncbi:MAG: hypothetical protein AB4050_07400 [Synechococcus sp.]